jgi:hypothetical protein
MTKKQAGKLYKGKYFYEVRRKNSSTNEFIVNGPMSTIRYISKAATKKLGYSMRYDFCQVINGKIVQVFTKDEILVTTKPLGGFIL